MRARCLAAPCARGFTMAEMLVVVAIIAILAVAAVPLLAANHVKLDVASEEIAGALRFALSESRRTVGYILVDAGTTPGRVQVLNSDVAAVRGSDVTDPLTKRAMNIDVTGSAFSQGVTLNPRFVGPSGTYPQLLIGPGPTFWAAQSSAVMGALQPGSGIDLTLGSRSVTVSFDSVSGRVVLP